MATKRVALRAGLALVLGHTKRAHEIQAWMEAHEETCSTPGVVSYSVLTSGKRATCNKCGRWGPDDGR